MSNSVAGIRLRPRVSPLRYPGGKVALYARLRCLLRASGLAGATYVEPYAGGAGAGLALLATGQVKAVVLNDLDPAIFAFWRTLQEDPDYLERRLLETPITVEEWRRQKAIYSRGQSAERCELAFATFFLNRTNRSGVLNGGPIGGLAQTGNYKIDARFNRADLAERVRLLGRYSRSITALCRDGVEVIREYASQPETFIYADPPYFEKAGSLYLNSFEQEDHERLAQVLNSVPTASWLLTYDDVPEVHKLYESRRRRTFKLGYSAHRVRTATEVAVLSDSLADFDEGWPLGATWCDEHEA